MAPMIVANRPLSALPGLATSSPRKSIRRLLKKFGSPPLLGYLPDSQRYFDVHHSANDVFERVNKRELELGAAGMASMIYMIDKYGVPNPGHFHH